MRRSQRQRANPAWQREYDLTGGLVEVGGGEDDEPPGLLVGGDNDDSEPEDFDAEEEGVNPGGGEGAEAEEVRVHEEVEVVEGEEALLREGADQVLAQLQAVAEQAPEIDEEEKKWRKVIFIMEEQMLLKEEVCLKESTH